MNALNLQSILRFARETAVLAGEIIVREREQNQVSQNYKGTELVTSADLKSDELIRSRIAAAYPDHRILSEESSPQLKSWAEGPLWIVDPIDGTVNYAYGQNQTAVCLAFAFSGVVEAGVVHVPFERETFTAIRGQGAWLNGQSIRPSGQTELARSLIATGFPYPHDRARQMDLLMKRLRSVMDHCRDIRRGGSAAIDACWVAMGRLDGYYETVNPWDIAAAGLVAREAGARVGNLVEVPKDIPADLYSREVVVASPAIYDGLFSLLSRSS